MNLRQLTTCNNLLHNTRTIHYICISATLLLMKYKDNRFIFQR